MKRRATALLSILVLAVAVVCLGACSKETEPAEGPIQLEIRDSYAGVSAGKDGLAHLDMQGVIQNNSELKTAELADLPQLTMDGEVIEATYEPVDTETADKLEPGKSIAYTVSYDFDASQDHEWGFKSADDTVVEGLDQYVKIKEALRDYEGKAQVSEEDLAEVEQDAEQRYQEFLEEEAAKEEASQE